ncbi:class I SAM-dependent methyltransferase [Primorskyibacter sp. S187A]|uniref:class I SAM-dependent methyltransferase n=1 Tax=Primorskyibacter sp. S187A TaxID=3415130 RepID=UPI003C7C952D
MPFSTRLTMARDAGLVLPDGPVAVWGVTPSSDISALDHAQIISRDARVHDRFPDALETPAGPYGACVVLLPREKKRAQAFLAEAARSTGPLIVDGQKTDGIEPVFKALKKMGETSGPVSKSHGKLFWMEAAPDLSIWRATPGEVEGLRTWPGVFSDSKVDVGSRLLAQALPAKLGTSLCDLGAGWGWLSAQVQAEGRDIHMVEADGEALDCAHHNVPDATAHWADVTRWQHPRLFDTVIMNPPFHEGRKGKPDLGQSFIMKAAEILKPTGQLFMVANRHLPYEDTLAAQFAHVEEMPGDGRFKIFRATRPSRRRR